MTDSLQVIAYEQQREPPSLVREPGRVALVMPAVSWWVRAFQVSIHLASCVAVSVLAVIFLRAMWRAPAGPAAPGTYAIWAFLFGLPVLFIAILAFQVRWWLTTSRHPPVVEVRGGELLWSRAGFWVIKLRRVPLTSVRRMSVRRTRTIGPLYVVRVRVDFVGWRPRLRRGFIATDPAFAEEAEKAFAAAIAEGAAVNATELS